MSTWRPDEHDDLDTAIDAEWPALRAAFEAWLAPDNFDASGRQRISLSALTAPIRVSQDPVLASAPKPD